MPIRGNWVLWPGWLTHKILLIVAAVLWHGVTIGTFARVWHDLAEQPTGSMSFRIILQTSIAAIIAIHDGLRNARTGRSPFFGRCCASRKSALQGCARD